MRPAVAAGHALQAVAVLLRRPSVGEIVGLALQLKRIPLRGAV